MPTFPLATPACPAPRRLPVGAGDADYAAQGETGVTLYNARRDPRVAVVARRPRRAHVGPQADRRGLRQGRSSSYYRRHLARLFDLFFGAQYAGVLPVPVSIPVGIGGKEAYLDQLRRQFAASGAVARSAVDDLAVTWAMPPRNSRRFACTGGMDVIDALPEKPVDLRPLGPDDDCYIQFSSGSTRHPQRRAHRSARPDGQSRGHDGAGRSRSHARRPHGQLAAALSRHGPDRLHDGAARQPELDRLSDAARLRAPAMQCST